MAYRSILVLVDSQRGSQARIDAAIRIAASNHALLTGVWLKSEHPPGFANEEGLIAPVLAGLCLALQVFLALTMPAHVAETNQLVTELPDWAAPGYDGLEIAP